VVTPPIPMRLTVVDASQLEYVSTVLQDAVAQLGDFDYSARTRSFTIALNRFCWEDKGRAKRVRTGLQIAGVTAAKSQNIRQGADDAVVNLLSIRFEAGDAPAGVIVLTFSGDGELRLEIECLDLVLADISQPWGATRRPKHSDATQ
jgi:hypothetical protein